MRKMQPVKRNGCARVYEAYKPTLHKKDPVDRSAGALQSSANSAIAELIPL